MTEPTPAGWYPDPGNSGQQRYWDGTAWTENFAPGSADAAPAAVVAKKPIYKRTWFIVIAALFVLSAIGNAMGGDPSTAPEPTPAVTESTPPPAEVAPAAAEVAPEPEPEPEPEPAPVEEPAEPALTVSQEQALQSAQSYLDMGGFSKKKLIDQLVYEDFSKGDATFAAEYIDPDWKAQAAQSAESYMDMGGFSKQKLIDQLKYEGFTKAQAEYGAKAAGY